MSIWLFQAENESYNLREEVPLRLNNGDYWLVRRYFKKMKVGDTALLWQSGPDAGLYATAKVIGEPYLEKTAPRTKPAWRVDLGYNPLLEHPVLKTTLVKHPTLKHLAVLKQPFAANPFLIDSAEWRALQQVISGDWQSQQSKSVEREVVKAAGQAKARSQGFTISPAARKAVEIYSMKKAAVHFRKDGFSVTDVSKVESYDLHCKSERHELHVEVKGTQTDGDEILLTPSEVKLARAKSPHTALFLVHSVNVTGSDVEPRVSGGCIRIIRPWNPTDAMLTPLGYSCELPHERVES